MSGCNCNSKEDVVEVSDGCECGCSSHEHSALSPAEQLKQLKAYKVAIDKESKDVSKMIAQLSKALKTKKKK